jgi:hypothetical protein
MPANLVHGADDERHWKAAKKRAEEQGHAGDWAYVVGIFKQMSKSGRADNIDAARKADVDGFSYAMEMDGMAIGDGPDMQKATSAFQMPQRSNDPGQVPRFTIPPSLTDMPKPVDSVKARLDFDGPVLRPEGLTKGLPMEGTQARAFQKFVGSLMKGNELTFRSSIMKHLHYDLKADPMLRKALMQRSLSFWKAKGAPSDQPRLTMRMESATLEKADPRGGNYHRRVTNPETGKHRYFYSEEDYAKRPDAHVSGAEAKKAAAKKAVLAHVGDAGATIDSVKQALSGKHADQDLADAIRSHVESGKLTHNNGKLTKDPEMNKALPTGTEEGAHGKKPAKYADVATEQFADPAGKRYPLDTEAHVRAALSYFSKPANASVYSQAEQKTMMGRIKAAAKKHGIEVSDEAGPPSIEKGMQNAPPKPGQLPKQDPGTLKQEHEAEKQANIEAGNIEKATRQPTPKLSKGLNEWLQNEDAMSKSKSMNPAGQNNMDLCKCGPMAKAANGLCKACGKKMPMAKAESTGISSDFGGNPDSTDTVSVKEVDDTDDVAKAAFGDDEDAEPTPDDEADEGEKDMEKGLEAGPAPDPQTEDINQGTYNGSDADKDAETVAETRLAKGGLGEWLQKGGGEGSRGGHITGHTASGEPIYGEHPGGIHPGVHKVLKDIHEGKGPGMGGEHHEAAMKQGLMKKNPKGQMALTPKGKETLNDANLGKTSSGKPIGSGRDFQKKGLGSPTFGVHSAEDKAKFNEQHKDWSAQDHKDALKAHNEAQMDSKSETAKDRHYAMQMAHMRAAQEKGGATNKSMAGKNDMEAFQKNGLSAWMKSNIPGADDTSGGQDPQDMPEGVPTDVDQGKDVNGPMMDLDGMGAAGGSSPGEKGLDSVASGKQEKLNADDPDADSMQAGAPYITGALPEADGNIGQGKGTLTKSQRALESRSDMAAASRYAVGARQASMPQDVTAGVGRAPPRPQAAPAPAGEAMSKSDADVEALFKGDGFYTGGVSPTLDGRGTLQKSMGCPACGSTTPAWLSRCPSCGVDISGASLQKSMRVESNIPAIRAPGIRARVQADLVLPGGVRLPKV